MVLEFKNFRINISCSPVKSSTGNYLSTITQGLLLDEKHNMVDQGTDDFKSRNSTQIHSSASALVSSQQLFKNVLLLHNAQD